MGGRCINPRRVLERMQGLLHNALKYAILSFRRYAWLIGSDVLTEDWICTARTILPPVHHLGRPIV